jgi:hypothetical protein
MFFRNKNFYQIAAEVISRLTGPPTEIPLLTIISFYPYLIGKEGGSFAVLLLPFLIIGWLLPISFFILALRRGWVGDLDATNRRERLVPYAVAVLCWSFLMVSAWAFLPWDLTRSFLGFYLLIFIIWLVTFFYKISVHAAVNTLLYWQVNSFFSWSLWWLFPLVLLVCWSRWVRKKHTVWQLVLGAAVAIIVSWWGGG